MDSRVVLLQTQQVYSNESQFQAQPPSSSSNNNHGFPIMAIAVLGITATIFLMISYSIFITNCCFFNWQTFDPLRRFSFRRRHRQNDDFLMAMYSSPNYRRRGLDELLIREIPTFQYSSSNNRGADAVVASAAAAAAAAAAEGEEQSSLFKCVVCLNEFQDQELLRLLPKCSHAFHLDCIDIWLQNNANCPLCRTNILGNAGRDLITAPNSSPREEEQPRPFIRTDMNLSMLGSDDEDFIVIDMSNGDDGNQRLLQGQQDRSDSYRRRHQQHTVQCRSRSHYSSSTKSEQIKQRKFHQHVSIMGDECIDVREKDDQFSSIQTIRRSFSMDSAADRHVYLSVQEIIRHNNNNNRREISESNRNNQEEEEESSSRSHRSIFSFGHGRGSRGSVQL